MEPRMISIKCIATAMLLWFSISTNAQTAVPTGPSANQIFKNAFSAYQEGNYAVAITGYNTAITTDPTRNYFYYNRGMAYKAMGNTSKAIADFNTCNNLKPTAEAYYQMGIIYFEKSDYENAKTQFENAKALREDIERMNFCLGMIYYRLDRLEDALKCFQEYTVTIRNYADAYYYRGLTEAKLGQYNEALVSFKFALRYKDTDWVLYYKMYEFYMALGDKQDALNSISMVIEVGEKKIEHYEKRAALYKELGFDFKYDEDIASINELKKAVDSTALSKN